MIPINLIFIFGLVLFSIGLIAFFVKRDLITMFMAVELMLNAANLIFIGFAQAFASLEGQIIVFFVITVAAAEAAIGLAIVMLIFRQKKTVKTEDLNLMKG
ncbi:MAG: NADH-quinone oxidoreductase subunit K [Candidatus Aminicenantes bacterium 4484_214]|nr:MAG: NADH-quinone oxidoreductase subunit K [Candidatus Aminicenantes bacterium 4484_214]RLE07613.1 MAG: NADH-quinone oxidoreductase subunit NuoK [Candidatus Aminicenantes bacterium]HDJ23816.1 NADH-quinone oxidoreductase subunit NuoK [Candidatus Aminicenantes bacterium]